MEMGPVTILDYPDRPRITPDNIPVPYYDVGLLSPLVHGVALMRDGLEEAIW